MADPLHLVAGVARQAFAAASGLPPDEVDPVVRPSDRADAQINGALALAKRVGTSPRELAQAVASSGALDQVCSAVAVALRPGALDTVTPCFLAASRLMLTGPPRPTVISFNVGVAAAMAGGRRYAVIVAIVMGFLGPLSIVAGLSPVSALRLWRCA